MKLFVSCAAVAGLMLVGLTGCSDTATVKHEAKVTTPGGTTTTTVEKKVEKTGNNPPPAP